MKKTYAIIGAILFIAAVVVGKIAGFDAAVPVSIGLGAFGFAALVAGAVKGSKEKNRKSKNKANLNCIIILLFVRVFKAGMIAPFWGLRWVPLSPCRKPLFY